MKDSLCLTKYESYLKNEKNASANTLASSLRDIRQLGEYLSSHTDLGFTAADEAVLTLSLIHISEPTRP